MNTFTIKTINFNFTRFFLLKLTLICSFAGFGYIFTKLLSIFSILLLIVIRQSISYKKDNGRIKFHIF